jgi:hypothetical protein
VTALVTGGAGFLFAVLWFDLMFDVQAIKHRGGAELPEEVLASVAGYYRRVTTEARAMSRLIAIVMAATLVAIALQLARADAPTWVSVASLALASWAIGLAATTTVRRAVRLGSRRDGAEAQSRLARSILRDHLLCAAVIAAVIAVQLAFAT